jgi:type IV fimbrial biogenesis protein FimT
MAMPTLIRGFTLLELVVAMTITGMLLMLGMPSFTTFLRNSEVRSTAESISNGLRAARTEATRLNQPVS